MNPGADEPDDIVLLRAVARRDEAALAALYDRHAGWLTVRLTRRCALPDVVDLAVQDTFLALWRQARTYIASATWLAMELIFDERAHRSLLVRIDCLFFGMVWLGTRLGPPAGGLLLRLGRSGCARAERSVGVWIAVNTVTVG